MQVRDLIGQGEVTKRRVKDGRGEFPMDCPLEDNRVQVHYTARLASTGQTVLDTRGPSGAGTPVEFDTGMGSICEALDMAVRLMTPEEVSTVRSTGQYAYDGRPDRPQVWCHAVCPVTACAGGSVVSFVMGQARMPVMAIFTDLRDSFSCEDPAKVCLSVYL